MSVSKIHIARFTGAAAKNVLHVFKYDCLGENNLNDFCIKFGAGLNSGLCNDYTMIWDNYSVGGDQIDYTYKILSSVSKCFGRIRASSWEIVFGFSFKPPFPIEVYREPACKIHRMIFLNTFKSTPLGHLYKPF